ncbi:MAG: efflux RND transporter periplasmic adaptor subunit [Phycisphaeraceae bacterium]|nr:MAG: efflux RND transporter periplasmic adaptor subunit [Phycisphaeraceae bacterium]
MSGISRATQAAAWVWRHTSTGIAVVLIVAAMVLGYRLGRPAEVSPADTATAEPADHSQAGPQMYTCSMHPWVRLPDPNARCPICHMALIPVSGNDTATEHPDRIVLSEAAAAMSRIETTPVARFFPTADARLYGKVTFDETSVARLTAYFPARIERLFVNYIGVPVAKGDHIAEVYSPELLAALEELRQAAKASSDAGDMSEIVRSATRATLVAAREKLRLYGLTNELIAEVESGAYQSDRLTIYAPIGGLVTNLDVREGDYLKEGSPIATVADLSRLWLDLGAYESQLPMLRWGQQVSFTVEAHPGETFEGRISFIEPMVDDRTRTAVVRVAVENSDHRLKPGMFASAVVHAKLAADGAVMSRDLAGRWVCPMHPTVVRDGPGDCDICGMALVTAESLGIVGDPSTLAEPLVIPRSAVLFTGTRSVAYVAVPDAPTPTYEGRQVVLGPRAGEFYIVREGLSEGEEVVVNGAFRIDSAMQIAAKPSMMTPAAGVGSASSDRPGPTVPDTFAVALRPVYSAYLEAQEALSSDDLEGFRRAAADLKAAIDAVSTAGLIGEPLGVWRNATARLRIAGPTPDIGVARTQFEAMSEGMISLEAAFGHGGDETWQVAYCPMAFDFKGAEWVQRGTEINNPYFGHKMLRCGEVRRALPPAEATEHRGAAQEGHDHE